MTAAKHRFYVPPSDVQDGRVMFSAAQARQIRSVLRLRPGDRVRVFDGFAESDLVVEIEPGEGGLLSGTIVGDLPRPSEPATRVVVYPSLLQRDKFEQVLQKLVEVGASAIVPVICQRSIVREGPDEARLARWRAIIQEAAEQSGRGMLPLLEPATPLAEALERAASEAPSLLAYEGERDFTLRAALRSLGSAARVNVFVGPEGGFDPSEVDRARSRSVQVITLGPRILRTETASPILTALVLHELDGR